MPDSEDEFWRWAQGMGPPIGPNKSPHEVSNHATFLGDGLYADFDGYNVEIFASNGIIRTNRVFLEPCVLEAFLRWVEALKNGPS
jgi:hypothetical protein